MEEYYGNILVILLVVIAVMVIVFIVIIMWWKNDKVKWEEKAQECYKRGKEEADEVIRITIDKIQDDKKKLSEMTEKELMVETMLVLGSYGRRLDRIEDKIIAISNYKAYIDSMNQQVQALAAHVLSLQDNINVAGTQVAIFKQDVVEIMNYVSEVNVKLAEVGNIGEKVDGLISKLSSNVAVMEDMNSQVNFISGKMDSFFENYSESPVVMLNSIKSLLSDVQYAVSDMESSLSEVSDSVDNFDRLLSDIRSGMSEAFDQYSGFSLYGKVESLKSEISSMKSTIDSSLDHYGYDSIYSKLDEIESRLNG